MGAGPSIISLPSTTVNKDVEVFKGICPSRFRCEQVIEEESKSKCTAYNNLQQATTILCDKQSSLTILLVPIPYAATKRIVTNQMTFVLNESELSRIITRCQQWRPHLIQWKKRNSTSSKSHVTVKPYEIGAIAELKLPGGASIALISPSAMSTKQERHNMALTLAQSMTHSLPKAVIVRTNSYNPPTPRSRNTTPVSHHHVNIESSRVPTPSDEQREGPERDDRSPSGVATGTDETSARDGPPLIKHSRSHSNNQLTIDSASSGCPPHPNTTPKQRVTRHHSYGTTKRNLNNNNGRFSPSSISIHSMGSSGNMSIAAAPKMLSPVQRGKLSPSALGYGSQYWPWTPKRATTSNSFKDRQQKEKQKQTVSEEMINKFPSLRCNLLHLNGKYQSDIVINSQQPFKVETELFIGQMVLIVRPPEEDIEKAILDYWNQKIFAHKQRRFMIQIQGKFKYEPKGIVFAGLEASNNDLQLGRLTKG